MAGRSKTDTAYLESALKRHGLRELSRMSGLSVSTLQNARRWGMTDYVRGKILPLARRTADEFKSIRASNEPPRRNVTYGTWDLEKIRRARDAQIAGVFCEPVALARSMRTDDVLFTAYHNRVGVQNAIASRLVPAPGTRGENVARRAGAAISIPQSTMADLHGTLANHGVAIAYNRKEFSADGTQVSFRVEHWPLEHVRYNAIADTLETATREMETVPIVHGDGTWTIVRRFREKPWTQDACVLPAAFIWAAHANGISDWAASISAHGRAKMHGTLPEGVQLTTTDGELTAEAKAFLDMLASLVIGESPAGLIPFGGKAEYVANSSSAHQIYNDLASNRERGAAKIYLGTDAFLGSPGGAPGVDISTLFGVGTTKLQGDFQAIAQGLNTGVYAPWTAINLGSSQYAPCFEYLYPDPDKARRDEQTDKNLQYFHEEIKRLKANNFTVDQDVIDSLASQYDIEPTPQLAPIAQVTVPLQLAPTDSATVVRVREARAAQNLPPVGDERDEMFLPQFKESMKTPAAPAAPAEGQPEVP